MMLKFSDYRSVAVSFAALGLLTACTHTLESVDRSEFVSVQTHRLHLEGVEYAFVGANFWYGGYLGAEGEIGDPKRLRRELDHLKSLGVTNLRVLGASEQSILKASLSPGIQNSEGVYRSDLLRGLDVLLDEMAKRDMKAVIYLNNFWE